MRSGNRHYHGYDFGLPHHLFQDQTDEQRERAIKYAEDKRKARRIRNLLRSWNGSLHNFGGTQRMFT